MRDSTTMLKFVLQLIYLLTLTNRVFNLSLSDFFPYGNEKGDIEITQLLDRDDGVLQIKTPHIPFFNRFENTDVQISTNGYVAFGKTAFNQFTSTEFPTIKNVAIIAPFWNDLEFDYRKGKFYYQLHKQGSALEKASNEILQRKGLDFQPHFVLVVTWFRVDIYTNAEATVTVQLALACDATQTYAFFLYNQLEGLSKVTSIGWNEGTTNTSNFFNHPFHRKSNDVVRRLVNESNIGKNGEWIYAVGEPEGKFPKIRQFPVVSAGSENHRVVFNCTLVDIIEDEESVFEVTWYTGNKKINKSEILQNGKTSSFLRNDRVPGNGTNLFQFGTEISCKVRTWYKNTSSIKSRYYHSNKFFAGIKTEPRFLTVSEGSQPVKVNVTSTVAILCADGTTSCAVTVSFPFQGTDIQLSTCTITFTPSSALTQELLVYSTQDFIDDGQNTATISPRVNYPSNLFDWESHASSPPIEVTTVDVPTGYCSSSGDPYIKTFDAQWYAFFNIGDFVLVQSPKNNFKVHIRTFDCLQRITCNCAVVAQENDDVVAIDMCNSAAPTFRFPTRHPPSIGTQLKVNNPTRFEIEFASGATITFQVHKRRGHRPSFANVYVKIPSIYYQSTVGLCGRYDRNRYNDMTSKSGRVYNNKYPAHPNFVNSWKLRNETSLFFKKSGNKTCDKSLSYTNDTNLCVCHDRPGVMIPSCAINRFAIKPTFTAATDFKTIVSAAFSDCNRRKRRSVSNTIVVPDEGDDTIYEYNPPDRPFVAPTWPTSSGKTKQEVETFCDNAILNSTSGKECSITLKTDFDLVTYRRECVSDIQISDSYDYIQSIIDSMTSSCVETVLKGVQKYWVKNDNGTLGPPATVGNNICPNDCSENGQCVNSVCYCNDGFEGQDCSIKKGEPPSVVPNVQLCDGRSKACLNVKVIGSNIKTSGSVFCKITSKRGKNSVVSEGLVVSFAEVICTLPSPPLILTGDLSKNTGKAYDSFDVQLSNDGTTFSDNSTTLVVYDSNCIACDSTTGACDIKSKTCKIHGYCFSEGGSNPSCSVKQCVPSVNKHHFVIKNAITNINPWHAKAKCPKCLCNGKKNRHYRYPGSSHFFLTCANGRAHCRTCWPRFLHFVERCNQCLYKLTDSCYRKDTSYDFEEAKRAGSSSCPDICSQSARDSIGNIPHPTNPRRYIACYYGKTVRCMNCPRNLRFDEDDKSCTRPLDR